MDNLQNYAAMGGIGGVIITIGLVLFKIFHHRGCRSKCCGGEVEISNDVKEDNQAPTHEVGGYSLPHTMGKDAHHPPI